MKIKAIEFVNHPVFGNNTISFTNGDTPNVVFLVGNNGSGKTHLLEAIYTVFTKNFHEYGQNYEITTTLDLLDEEKLIFGTAEQGNEILYTVKSSQREHDFISWRNGTRVGYNQFQQLTKLIYSTAELIFSAEAFTSVTAMNIDDVAIPKERSENLSIDIPQLLIDIDALDSVEIASWARAHPGGIIPNDIGVRLKRFTDAFSKIYGGEKTFSAIRNENGQKKIFFITANGEEVSINQLSTGERQIIYRVGHILKQLGTSQNSIILIDEPELSLHPTWQIRLKEFLLDVFAPYNVQIFIATHSPYILKNLKKDTESCIKVDRLQQNTVPITMGFVGIPPIYKPSVELISYLAYGIVEPTLHIELYTLLHIKTGIGSEKALEAWLRDPAGGNMRIAQSFTRTGTSVTKDETIMTWIRNKLHHGDEAARPDFTDLDLKTSIDAMIRILQQ